MRARCPHDPAQEARITSLVDRARGPAVIRSLGNAAPIRWLLRILGRAPKIPANELRDYQSAVMPLLERAECLYQQWVDQSENLNDGERVANIASSQSWEIATLTDRLEACTPPVGLEEIHRRCTRSFSLARRAGRLLSTGYRYHSTDALCDGHAALEDARELYLSVMARLVELSSPESQSR